MAADDPLSTGALQDIHEQATEFVRGMIDDEGHSSMLVGLALLSVGSLLLNRALGEDAAADMIGSLHHCFRDHAALDGKPR